MKKINLIGTVSASVIFILGTVFASTYTKQPDGTIIKQDNLDSKGIDETIAALNREIEGLDSGIRYQNDILAELTRKRDLLATELAALLDAKKK